MKLESPEKKEEQSAQLPALDVIPRPASHDPKKKYAARGGRSGLAGAQGLEIPRLEIHFLSQGVAQATPWVTLLSSIFPSAPSLDHLVGKKKNNCLVVLQPMVIPCITDPLLNPQDPPGADEALLALWALEEPVSHAHQSQQRDASGCLKATAGLMHKLSVFGNQILCTMGTMGVGDTSHSSMAAVIQRCSPETACDSGARRRFRAPIQFEFQKQTDFQGGGDRAHLFPGRRNLYHGPNF